MSELRSIDSVPVAANVVETLEGLLKSARDGEISQLAVATVGRDGTTNNTWTFLHSTAAMLGSIEILKLRIMQKFDE